MKSEKVQSILDAGLKLWKSGGSSAVTHRSIATAIGCNPAGVLYHFGYSMVELRKAVAEYAVETNCDAVILQLMASDHAAITGLSAERRTALAAML